MRVIRRFALLIVLVLALALTGCGGGGADTESTDGITVVTKPMRGPQDEVCLLQLSPAQLQFFRDAWSVLTASQAKQVCVLEKGRGEYDYTQHFYLVSKDSNGDMQTYAVAMQSAGERLATGLSKEQLAKLSAAHLLLLASMRIVEPSNSVQVPFVFYRPVTVPKQGKGQSSSSMGHVSYVQYGDGRPVSVHDAQVQMPPAGYERYFTWGK